MINIQFNIKINNDRATMDTSLTGRFDTEYEVISSMSVLAILEIVARDEFTDILNEKGNELFEKEIKKAKTKLKDGIDDFENLRQLFSVE